MKRLLIVGLLVHVSQVSFTSFAGEDLSLQDKNKRCCRAAVATVTSIGTIALGGLLYMPSSASQTSMSAGIALSLAGAGVGLVALHYSCRKDQKLQDNKNSVLHPLLRHQFSDDIV